MKILNPDEYRTFEINDDETRRFEDFLDRNYPGWRDRQMFKTQYAGSIQRRWRIATDEMERAAFYRKTFVEVVDECYETTDDDTTLHLTKHVICDINGDSTPVAVWGKQ